MMISKFVIWIAEIEVKNFHELLFIFFSLGMYIELCKLYLEMLINSFI